MRNVGERQAQSGTLAFTETFFVYICVYVSYMIVETTFESREPVHVTIPGYNGV